MNDWGTFKITRHGIPHSCVGILVGLSCLTSAIAMAAGPKAVLPHEFLNTRKPALDATTNPAKTEPEATLTPKNKLGTETKIVKGSRYTGRMRQFRDPKGCYILTNVPEKYRDRKDFVEINIKYETIVVQQEYKKYKSAEQYPTGKIADLVTHYSKMYAIDESLVYAVIQAESAGNPYAVSTAGARGLMQLMPATAAEMGVRDLYDPAQNIAGGTQYLAKMLGLFNNDVALALAAYNAGPNAVKESGGIPPYAETQNYVRTILNRLNGKTKSGITSLNYAVRSPRPKAYELPTDTHKAYTIYFRSGYTQRAEKVSSDDQYYRVQYDGRVALIRKQQVEKIVGPAES